MNFKDLLKNNIKRKIKERNSEKNKLSDYQMDIIKKSMLNYDILSQSGISVVLSRGKEKNKYLFKNKDNELLGVMTDLNNIIYRDGCEKDFFYNSVMFGITLLDIQHLSIVDKNLEKIKEKEKELDCEVNEIINLIEDTDLSVKFIKEDSFSKEYICETSDGDEILKFSYGVFGLYVKEKDYESKKSKIEFLEYLAEVAADKICLKM